MALYRKGQKVFINRDGEGFVGRVTRPVEGTSVFVTDTLQPNAGELGPFDLSEVEPLADEGTQKRRVYLVCCDNGHIRRGTPSDPACHCVSAREVLFFEATTPINWKREG